MAEQAKAAPAPATPEQSYPPPTILPYPHQAYTGGAFPPTAPPGTYMPPMFAYPPPADGAHAEGHNGAVPAPYMVAIPGGGVVYAYPPAAQPPGFPPLSTPPPGLNAKPKRKQVKMACTNCATACKRCDESRPCERCVKYSLAESCVDGVRKERRKGVKRGPYKRKSKEQMEAGNLNGDFTPGAAPGSSATTPPAAIHAAPPYVAEGYYPLYYPPHGFLPHGPDGQPTADGAPHANGQHPFIPYVMHPTVYPPFTHYPLYPHQPSAPIPPPAGTPAAAPTPQPTVVVAAANPAPQASAQEPQRLIVITQADDVKKSDETSGATNGNAVVDPALKGKKRVRTSTKNGEQKSKKLKTNGLATRTGEEGSEIGISPGAIMNGGTDASQGA